MNLHQRKNYSIRELGSLDRFGCQKLSIYWHQQELKIKEKDKPEKTHDLNIMLL